MCKVIKFLFFIILLKVCNLDSKNIQEEQFVFQETKNYIFVEKNIDVVFVAHEKDKRSLDLAIVAAKKHIKNVRNVIVVSAKKLTDNAEWFDEAKFPFTKKTIALEIFSQDNDLAENYIKSTFRISWIYQQFLKLYSMFIIPNISSNVLVIDSDTIFLNDVNFLNEKNGGLYSVGKDYFKPYFWHGERVFPGFKRLYPKHSGIVHHMLFQRPVLEDFFQSIEKIHKAQVWQALSRLIDKNYLYRPSLSEYELYFNFVFARTSQVDIRPLKWTNVAFAECDFYQLAKDGYDQVSCHTYLGK